MSNNESEKGVDLIDRREFRKRYKEYLNHSTFKVKKISLKKEGFDIDIIDDALYVMLPHESNYVPLTKKIYNDIQHGIIKL